MMTCKGTGCWRDWASGCCGRRYAIHELALTPDTVSDEIGTDIRKSLARTIKVNARPLTVAEWSQLLSAHGLVVDHVATAPMALLQPKDLLLQPVACKRFLLMRSTFRKHRSHWRRSRSSRTSPPGRYDDGN